MDKKKIMIIGNPGGNVGDEAAMKGIVYGLKNLYGNAVELYVSYSGEMQHETIDKYVKAYFNDEEFFAKKHIFKLLSLKFVKCKQKNSPLYHLQTADLVLIAPGGCGIHAFNKMHWYKLIILLNVLKNNIMLYGCSMGPFNKSQGQLLTYITKKVKCITLRDSTSLEYINELGGIDKNIFNITSDSALQIPIKNKELRIKPKKLRVAITPIDLGNFKKFTHIADKTPKLIEAFSGVLNWLYENEYLESVTFVPHVNIERDRMVVDEIVKKLKFRDKIFYEEYKAAEEVLLDYSKYDLCIGARHHSAAFALKMGVPALCVGYEHKAKGFFMQCGLEKYVLDIEDLSSNKIIDMTKDILDNYEQIVKNIADNMPKMEEMALENSKCVGDLLGINALNSTKIV